MNKRDALKRDADILIKNISAVTADVNQKYEMISSFTEDLALAVLELAALDVEENRFATPLGALEHECRALFGSKLVPTGEVIEENYRFIKSVRRSQLSALHIKLCSCIGERFEDVFGFPYNWLESFADEGEEVTVKEPGQITYFKNIYADAAYQVFSHHIKRPRAVYQSSFSAVCEDVYNGESEYGILPLENLIDGRLPAFGALINRFDLKVVGGCYVPSADGQNETFFVLLSRTLSDFTGDGEYYASLNFSPSGKNSLDVFFTAVSEFDLTAVKVDSVRRPYVEDSYSLDVLIKCTKKSFTPFSLYLALSGVQCTLTGVFSIYK
ncbi:MAG: hypothetical protein IKV54_02505 [Clostridia bacterium]|nr:hypothetical protein [Clostridia bacterium]